MSTNRHTSRHTSANQDRRVIRTRQLLKESMLALVLERGYDAVTIQDITDHANLGRATFYIHYRDKEDLLMQALTEMFDNLVKEAGAFVFPAEEGQRPIHAEFIFRHAQQNQMLYRVMLGSNAANSLTRRIREYIVETNKRIITEIIPEEALPLPIDVLANHTAGSLLGLLMWWLENDLPYPPETMAEMFRKLHFGAVAMQLLAAQQNGG